MGTVEEEIEIVIVDAQKRPKPRYPDESYDENIASLMTFWGSNFYGLYRLKTLRAFLENVARDC